MLRAIKMLARTWDNISNYCSLQHTNIYLSQCSKKCSIKIKEM